MAAPGNRYRRARGREPAASTVYELTEDGEALRPAVLELIRWGGRRLLPQRPGERVEPDWMRLALVAYARKGPSPARSFNLVVRGDGGEAAISVRGGPQGTTVGEGRAEADVDITADLVTVLGLMAGLLDPSEALSRGLIRVEGDTAALADLPRLFDARPGVEAPIAER